MEANVGSGREREMWRIIRAMYSKVSSCVLVDGEQSQWFDSMVGVRQGCVLSPILYSVFINGFAKFIKASGTGGVTIGSDTLSLLLFADDIVMFAESAEKLQNMWQLLEEYCKKWRFEVNVDKSKVMVCGTKSALNTEEDFVWKFCGKQVERVREYKYVGVIVNDVGDWTAQIDRVINKARKSTATLTNTVFRHFGISVRAKMQVWQAIVGSSMRYGSEVWWAQTKDAAALEAIQLGAMKNILRLNRSTTTAFVRGELALPELSRARDKSMLMWAGQVAGMPDTRWPRRLSINTFVVKANLGCNRKPWSRIVQLTAEKYGIARALDDMRAGFSSSEDWGSVVDKAIHANMIDEWRDDVLRGKKLDNYSNIKREWGFERFLEGDHTKGAILMTRFRSGTSGLGEEMARWARQIADIDTLAEEVPMNKPVAGQCACCASGEVETVRHVMIHCTAYNDIRSEWKADMLRVARNGNDMCREFRVDGIVRNTILKVKDESKEVVVRRSSRQIERNRKDPKNKQKQENEMKEMKETKKIESNHESDEGFLRVGLGGRCPWMTDSEYADVLLCSQRFVHALWVVRVSIIHPRVKPCGVNGHLQAKT